MALEGESGRATGLGKTMAGKAGPSVRGRGTKDGGRKSHSWMQCVMDTGDGQPGFEPRPCNSFEK